MSRAILVAVASVVMAFPSSIAAQQRPTENDPTSNNAENSEEWRERARKAVDNYQARLREARGKADWAEHKQYYDLLGAFLFCAGLERRGAFSAEEMATLRRQLEFEREEYVRGLCEIAESDETLGGIDLKDPNAAAPADYREVAASNYVDPFNTSQAVRDRAAHYRQAIVDAHRNDDRAAIQQLLIKFGKLRQYAEQRLKNWESYSAIAREQYPLDEVSADSKFIARELIMSQQFARQIRGCGKKEADCQDVELPCLGDMMEQGEDDGGCEYEFSDCEPPTDKWLPDICDPPNSLTGITVAVADMFGPEGLRIIPTEGVVVRVLDAAGQEVATTTTQNAMAADFVSLEPGKYILRLDIGEYEPALPPQCTDGYVRNIELSHGEHKRYAASVYSATVASNGQSVGTVIGECIKEQ